MKKSLFDLFFCFTHPLLDLIYKYIGSLWFVFFWFLTLFVLFYSSVHHLTVTVLGFLLQGVPYPLLHSSSVSLRPSSDSSNSFLSFLWGILHRPKSYIVLYSGRLFTILLSSSYRNLEMILEVFRRFFLPTSLVLSSCFATFITQLILDYLYVVPLTPFGGPVVTTLLFPFFLFCRDSLRFRSGEVCFGGVTLISLIDHLDSCR